MLFAFMTALECLPIIFKTMLALGPAVALRAAGRSSTRSRPRSGSGCGCRPSTRRPTRSPGPGWPPPRRGPPARWRPSRGPPAWCSRRSSTSPGGRSTAGVTSSSAYDDPPARRRLDGRHGLSRAKGDAPHRMSAARCMRERLDDHPRRPGTSPGRAGRAGCTRGSVAPGVRARPARRARAPALGPRYLGPRTAPGGSVTWGTRLPADDVLRLLGDDRI